MRRVLIIAAAAALMASTAASQSFDFQSAPEPTAAPPEPADPNADESRDPHRIVCKSARPRTGTRLMRGSFKSKTCLTTADWQRLEDEAREVIKMRDNGLCADNTSRSPCAD